MITSFHIPYVSVVLGLGGPPKAATVQYVLQHLPVLLAFFLEELRVSSLPAPARSTHTPPLPPPRQGQCLQTAQGGVGEDTVPAQLTSPCVTSRGYPGAFCPEQLKTKGRVVVCVVASAPGAGAGVRRSPSSCHSRLSLLRGWCHSRTATSRTRSCC